MIARRVMSGLLLAWGPLAAIVPASEPTPAAIEQFEKQVRPLLAARCWKCHGDQKQQASLRLDSAAAVAAGGDSGPAVVPGDPEHSPMIQAIRYAEDPKMPPDGKLSDGEIALLTAWVKTGASWPRYSDDVQPADQVPATLPDPPPPGERDPLWALRPVADPDPPATQTTPPPKNMIDRFVQARLEQLGLAPAPAADKRTLVRRAYFDLLGLPPSLDEVAQFVNDVGEDAFARLVEKLLASPHYGERWGRHWLDVARYADSGGYETDMYFRNAWRYRDYVVKSFNDDKPYDRFVQEQIAADEIWPDDLSLDGTYVMPKSKIEHLEARIGTGLYALGTQIHESNMDGKKLDYERLTDWADTTGSVFLGLTVGCARCHDHKFDPIPQADYYRVVSTFTTTVRSEVELDFHPERYRAAQAAFDRDHAPLVDALAKFESQELPSRFAAFLAAPPKPMAPKWLIVDAANTKSDGGATFTPQSDGSYLVGGKNATNEVYTIVVQTKRQGITAVRLEALADDSLPKRGPGRAPNGNFALSNLQLWVAAAGAQGPGAPVKLTQPLATFSQESLPVASAIDDNKKSAWAVDPQVGQNQAASFEIETPVSNPQGTTLTFTLKFENNAGHNLGRFRLSLSTAAKPVGLEGDEAAERRIDEVNQALATPAAERTEAQRATLLDWYRRQDETWQKLNGAVQEHAKQTPKPELTKVMIASEGLPAIRFHTQGADFFDKTYYLRRGDLNQKVGEASSGFLQVLVRVPDGEQHWRSTPPAGSRLSLRRTGLAHWITDVDGGAGHLLARVIVNRLWQHHLGRGLVATPSDFGASGQRPSHPELLDYLAGQLIEGGWRLKDVHKLIMTSAVYMQSVGTDAPRAAADPDNILLWHRSRQRLEAEVIRDAMLAVSGQLDERMYGPGSLDETQRRRSIYFTVKRSQLVPSMMLFDAPDSLGGLGQRAATIVAPQALAMLNSALVQSSARALAHACLSAPGCTTEAAIQRAYQTGLARTADAEELADSVAFFTRAAETYKAAGKTDATEAALADFCQVLLGMNEFIYID